MNRLQTNERREKEAFKVCSQKIAERGLEMRLVDVECAFRREQPFVLLHGGRKD